LSGNIRIALLGLLTITLFPGLGWVVSFFIEGNWDYFLESFKTQKSILLEVVSGIIAGVVFGLLAWRVINTKFLLPVLSKYGHVVKSLKLNIPTIVFVSICAGVGEEIFFRGVVQDYLGVILTAILFVAIHGYLSISDWRISVYGSYMTLVIVSIGFMDKFIGLTSAMIAHTTIDIILFYKLSSNKENLKKEYFEGDLQDF
jgi:membrane protease YdiL (CAAX protease family)